MSTLQITRDEVVARSACLSGFPDIVVKILGALDDPDANLNELVRYIGLDPLVTARVLAAANKAAVRGSRTNEVCDIYTATSLIGLQQVREITLIGSLGGFIGRAARDHAPDSFRSHCVAVGVCCQELAQRVGARVEPEAALVTGLMHDIGQLWLYHFDAEAYRACWREALSRRVHAEVVELAHFGASHATIGAWLAESWGLPASICAAIRWHHMPDAALDNSLVPLVHVAEVLSNALEITDRESNRVISISSAACNQLGVVWNADIQPLFGRMVARSREINSLFQLPNAQ